MITKKILLIITLCFMTILLGSCESEKNTYQYVDINGVVCYTETKQLYEKPQLNHFPNIEGYEILSYYQEKIDEFSFIIHPIYIKQNYTVSFIGFNNEVLKKESVAFEESATAPTVNNTQGFVFSGWDVPFDKITSNLTVKAVFTKEQYKVWFVNEKGTLLKEEMVDYNESVEPPVVLDTVSHSFVGWESNNESTIDNIISDVIFTSIFQIKTFKVTFYNGDGEVEKEEYVNYGGEATAPILPDIEGSEFKGWDVGFTNITADTEVYPLYAKKSVILKSYVNYQSELDADDFNFSTINKITISIPVSELTTDLEYTFININYGGFRGTNAIHLYDESNIRSRNAYGFEIAVSADGFIIDKAVKVELPEGGFIVSGHGSAGTLLDDYTVNGQYVVYDQTLNTVKVYNNNIGKCLALEMSIKDYQNQIIEANNNFKALNYGELISKMNFAIDIYNQLILNYDETKIDNINTLLTEISFLLIETNGIETKAFWHYPLRAGSYTENNLEEVQEFLQLIKELGFNRIITNTNFNGGSVYKSDYLVQKKASSNKYTGYKDYLECFIEEAHKLDIEVCAWTNTFICGDGSISPTFTSKDWVLKNYNGDISFGGMYYYDISNKEVQTFLGNVYYELANEYNLDGIEFDFIRFPSSTMYRYTGIIGDDVSISDSGYTTSFINSFIEKYNIDGDETSIRSILRNNEDIRANWIAYKKELVTYMVTMLIEKIKSTKPNMIISAAVMPSIQTALNVYSQNWLEWIETGKVDTLEPMVYSGSVDYVANTTNTFVSTVNNQAFINVGIYPEGDGGTPNISALQIDYITKTYNIGWAKFSSKTILSNMDWMSGIKHLVREYTVSCNDEKAKQAFAYAYNSYDIITNYYALKDSTFDYSEIKLNLESIINNFQDPDEVKNVILLIEKDINKITNQKIKDNLLKDTIQIMQLLNISK